ncbi:MAG: DUF2062 domain-containing protein [Epsilonproteobacteria bacterium]|nr:DUF2062 domain-containing protein [Campylobacterota bacterium]
MNIKNIFHLLKTLMIQYGSVKKIALGFATGVFISITPTFGFHMILAAIFSTIFKINRASAILGTWFNNPLTTPIIYYIDYKIGARIVGINGAAFSLKPFTMEHYLSISSAIFIPTSIGSIILGIPIAVICYLIIKFFLKKHFNKLTSI